jgi:hypothetical protein
MTCSWCRMARFEDKGFRMRCELTGEQVDPLDAACQEAVERDTKEKQEVDE